MVFYLQWIRKDDLYYSEIIQVNGKIPLSFRGFCIKGRDKCLALITTDEIADCFEWEM